MFDVGERNPAAKALKVRCKMEDGVYTGKVASSNKLCYVRNWKLGVVKPS